MLRQLQDSTHHSARAGFGMRLRVWLGTCLCLLLLCGTAAAEGDEDYNLAAGLFKQGRWSLASESFEKFLEKYPRHAKRANARMYVGLSLINQKQYAQARDHLRLFGRDHAENPALPQALYRIGECSYLLNDLAAAKTELRRFLKAAPEDPLGEWAYPYLADAELRSGDAAAALSDFEKSLELFPNGKLAEDSRFGIARAYQALDREDDALKAYGEIAQRPSGARAPEALMALGALHFDGGDFARSVEVYEEFLQRFPKHALAAKAQLNAGFAAFRLGEYASAISRFEAASGESAQAAAALYWKGNSLKNLGRFPEAAQTLEKALSHAEPPLDQDISFQWADVLLQSGQPAEARKRFLELAERWPQGSYAERALYLAAESALQQASTASGAEQQQAVRTAEELLERYDAAYPASGLERQAELLRARIWELRAAEGDIDRALAAYKQVLRQSTVEATRDRARYLLARLQQQQGDHAAAVATVGPLTSPASGDASSELEEALLLLGNSQFALEQYAPSVEALSRYLEATNDAELAAQALALRARGYAHLGQNVDALRDLNRLAEDHPMSRLIAPTTQQLADAAYARKDWDTAARLFQALVDLGKETPYFAAGLSGLGWTGYQKQDYASAAENFERASNVAGSERALAAEAAYMAGRSLQEAGKSAEAIAAYRAAFDRFAPANHSYLAGLQAARLLSKVDRVEDADAAYEELLERFPQPERLDKLLDEWALLNYQARRFKRSDTIFQRLIREVPTSDLVDNARFSLAESDLIDGRTEAAREAFQQLADDGATDETIRQNALYRLMGIAIEKQEWQRARQAAKDLQGQFPDGERIDDARFYFAQAQLALDEVDAAQAAAEALMQRSEEPAIQSAEWFDHLWILLAETHFRKKQYDKAMARIEELKSRRPDSPVIYQADEILGRIYKNQAQFEQAREAFSRVVESPAGRLTPTAAKSQFLIAETWFLEKEYATALREYLKVYHLYKHPQWQAPALFQAGRCDEAMGEWASAVQTYEDLLNTFPESEFAKQARERLAEVRPKAGQ